MQKPLGALLALAPVVICTAVFAAEHRGKPVVDFSITAKLNGSTTSLGKTRVVVKIQNAAVANDGTITVRATIADSDGIPLDRLGVATKGPVSMSLSRRTFPPGKPNMCRTPRR